MALIVADCEKQLLNVRKLADLRGIVGKKRVSNRKLCEMLNALDDPDKAMAVALFLEAHDVEYTWAIERVDYSQQRWNGDQLEILVIWKGAEPTYEPVESALALTDEELQRIANKQMLIDPQFEKRTKIETDRKRKATATTVGEEKRRRQPVLRLTNDVSITSNVQMPTMNEQAEFLLSVSRALEGKRLQQCDYLADFQKLELFGDKTLGVSPSISYRAAIKNRRGVLGTNVGVIIKMYFAPKNADSLSGYRYDALEAERIIYRDVVNPMILQRNTPHVVAYVGDLVCDDFAAQLERYLDNNATETHAQQLLRKAKKRWGDDAYQKNNMRAIVTERVDNAKTLQEYFEGVFAKPVGSATSRDDDVLLFETVFAPILFQMFYTLAVFEEIGLQHNDLHYNNVFAQEQPQFENVLYRVGKHHYRRSSKISLRIFDFDRSAKHATPYNDKTVKNKLLSQTVCREFGQCDDKLRTRYDIFTFVYRMYYMNLGLSSAPNSRLNAFLEFVVPRHMYRISTSKDRTKLRVGDMVYPGLYCLCKQDGCKTCVLPQNISEIKSAREVLESDFFKSMRVPPESLGAVAATDIWTLPSSQKNTEK